jgi:hypothetical protein
MRLLSSWRAESRAEWWTSTVEFVGVYWPPLIAATRALSLSGWSSAIDDSPKVAAAGEPLR